MRQTSGPFHPLTSVSTLDVFNDPKHSRRKTVHVFLSDRLREREKHCLIDLNIDLYTILNVSLHIFLPPPDQYFSPSVILCVFCPVTLRSSSLHLPFPRWVGEVCLSVYLQRGRVPFFFNTQNYTRELLS